MTPKAPTDLTVPTLGPREILSPLGLSTVEGDCIADYTPDDARIVYDLGGRSDLTFERAGPREMNFFAGERVAAGIVTCGGLCPGMNNVIRGIVRTLRTTYNVPRILGFQYGFRGLASDSPDTPMSLDPSQVENIHQLGGTLLGSSRGPQQPADMVDTLRHHGVNMLFCIGGDGTMRGVNAIYDEVQRRNAVISLVGIPKTIDNDLPHIERTFGFETAVSKASEAIFAASVEARCAPGGIGLVRLMGRHSGFIAASAAQACGQVDLVLVPELNFELAAIETYLRRRIKRQGHAVVVVAEGAGQHHLQASAAKDPSGNARLSDIGLFLREHFKSVLSDVSSTVKYIDPSYIIRAAPANAGDAIFCGRLAEGAVHAAMAGKTGMAMGLWANRFTHVPLSTVTAGRKQLNLDGPRWRAVIEQTGQPALLAS